MTEFFADHSAFITSAFKMFRGRAEDIPGHCLFNFVVSKSFVPRRCQNIFS